MHQTRNQTISLIPIKRKGTKYVARARDTSSFAVPVVVAVRDMLKLARTAKEVNEMIKSKTLKVNGKIVQERNQSIKLFYILEADKHYSLSLLPSGRFNFEEVKRDYKICKIINKTLFTGNTIQFNMNDGSNIISKDKMKIGDTVYIDFSGKIKKHISLEKGKEALVFSGKYIGNKVKLLDVKDSSVTIKVGDKEAAINQNQVIVL